MRPPPVPWPKAPPRTPRRSSTAPGEEAARPTNSPTTTARPAPPTTRRFRRPTGAERALLGAALLDPRRVAGAADWLLPLDFRVPAHARLWAAMLNNPPTADTDRYPMQLMQAMAKTGQPPASTAPACAASRRAAPTRITRPSTARWSPKPARTACSTPTAST
ncbi:DnaB-like helicase N-terminal domain-containing protein [Yinghuangia aomiensis]